jgi:hypothetical protein
VRYLGGPKAAPPTRPEAIRIALCDWLTGLDLIKERDDSENASGPKGRVRAEITDLGKTALDSYRMSSPWFGLHSAPRPGPPGSVRN